MISSTRICRAGSPLRKVPTFGTSFPFLRAGNCNMISSGQIIVRGLLVFGDGQLICNSDRKESAVLCASARSNTIGDLGSLLNLMLINKERQRQQQQPGKVFKLMLRIASKLMPHPPANVMCPSMM
ncbi:hypothetical protein SEVIR_9G517350v4 [Setaria viridis]